MSREKYRDVENYCGEKKSCKGDKDWEVGEFRWDLGVWGVV